MKSICLITIWMGPLPDYFDIWLKSTVNNNTVDFYVITDQKNDRYQLRENVHWINQSFDEVRDRFQELFDFKINLKQAYKLCDYKPVYAKAWKEITEQYDFVGYCDVDIVLGDVREFLTDDVLDEHERIFDGGHFNLMKNNDKMLNLYLLSADKKNHSYSYRDVYRTGYACYFDEFLGMSNLCWKYCRVLRDQMDEKMVFDFTWKKWMFTSFVSKKSYYCRWNDGHLFRYLCNKDGSICKDAEPEEIMYMHFQKRNMHVNIEALQSKEFWIVPNEFLVDESKRIVYSIEEQMKYEQEIAHMEKVKKIKNLKNNGLLPYIKHTIIRKRILRWTMKNKGFL